MQEKRRGRTAEQCAEIRETRRRAEDGRLVVMVIIDGRASAVSVSADGIYAVLHLPYGRECGTSWAAVNDAAHGRRSIVVRG